MNADAHVRRRVALDRLLDLYSVSFGCGRTLPNLLTMTLMPKRTSNCKVISVISIPNHNPPIAP